MNISPFPLPSDMTKVVHFRKPTVDDALLFCELNEAFEESATTEYLNHLQQLDKQQGQLNDSLLWTGEDRRTALWWIFIESQDDPSVTISYTCKTCKQDHFVDINLPELGLKATVLNKKPESTIDTHVQGKELLGVTVSPLLGESCEAIEQLRNIRDEFEPNSLDYRKANREMMLNELAHSLQFPDQPKDKDEALAYRLEKIKSMAVDTEFRSLCAKVEREMRAMRHGLLTHYEDGRFMLVADRPECDEKGGGKGVLLLPFRPNDFISKL